MRLSLVSSTILLYYLLMSCILSSCSYQRTPALIVLPNKPPPVRQLDNIKVALVLGGGGSRAVAHAGVLDVLEQHQIPIDLIVGCSAGSVIGALYADDPHSARLKEKIISLKKSDLLDPNWFTGFKMLWKLTGPVEGNALRLFIQDKISARDFNQLQIPLAVVTTNIDNGETFVINSGPLSPALHASSAVPMIFSPVTIYGKKLVDGGVASPVPVEVAKSFNPKVIIAIDINTSPDYGPVNSTLQLAMRSLHISYYRLSQWQTRQADVVINPDVNQFNMFDDHANEVLYEAGRKAALESLPQIKEILAQKL